ncbi:hypothetical protein K2173_018422 [Erythroxylum novogranatense]|uniref:LOB domain-containing protein n=1 Tax=Erythroxylum novogranatense TaxID=1862640 RepID=A0AAV8UAL0_9ROSI|nr:hypothetical protein K2173_018422 [Erythroxylum novogranatense]
MTGTGAPCGACKFLRRKCVKGCVFAPYFCHEQGATHFAAIHKVFGASNVSKLLAHLPVSDRCEAAVTISYEAQARLQDPIYGCVSHIFALQQQVVNLQAQLASLKEQAAQNFISASATVNSRDNYHGKNPSFPQDLHSWFQSENPNMVPQSQFYSNPNCNVPYFENEFLDPNSVGNYGNSTTSFNSFDEASQSMSSFDMQSDNTYQEADDLRSVAFGYAQLS